MQPRPRVNPKTPWGACRDSEQLGEPEQGVAGPERSEIEGKGHSQNCLAKGSKGTKAGQMMKLVFSQHSCYFAPSVSFPRHNGLAFDYDESLAGADRPAFNTAHLTDFTRTIGHDRYLHLHRFKN